VSAAHSAGILLWRRGAAGPEVLLGHFGGPYWARKDDGAWAIPKGLIELGESEEQAARREFREELGVEAPEPVSLLTTIRQKGGKLVTAFVAEGAFDPATLTSADMRIEWPPRSGEWQSFPEIDRVAWFGMTEARVKILPSQSPLLDALEGHVGAP
jgi:predicted NUDIX family NTP pyrophosphohydrolase